MTRSCLIAFLLAAVLAVPGVVFAEPESSQSPRPATPPVGPLPPQLLPQPASRTIRLFKLVHKSPGEAFGVIQPLLSQTGLITVAPRAGLVTVQDDEAHLKIVGEAIRQFDIAPKSYRVQVTFYRASGNVEESAAASAPAQLRGLGKKLANLLRYSQYAPIDEIVVTGEEGGSLIARIGTEYQIEFTIEGVAAGQSQIRLRNFQVSRIKKDDHGDELLSHVFRTSVNLQLEKPFVLGAARDEQSRTALLIALLAKPVGD